MTQTPQPDLFAAPVTARRVETPAARRNDPESSHIAADVVTKNGTRKRQQDEAAAAVKNHPGRTSQELAHLTGIDRYALARRLPECETAGTVKRGKQMECTITRRPAITWWPVE